MIFNLQKFFLPYNQGYQPSNPGIGGPRNTNNATRQSVHPWPYVLRALNYIGMPIYGTASSTAAPRFGPNLPQGNLSGCIVMTKTGIQKPETFGDNYF